jgi:hypothetical protein
MVRETALQTLWNDTCTVYVQEKVQNPNNKRTEFVETVLFENEPCKLSFESINTTSENGNISAVTQSVKLFLDNMLSVPSGSKIVVKRANNTFTYKKSGEPGIFTYHQEIPLELFDGWA